MFLNLCRLFSPIGYAAGHFKETHLTTHNRHAASCIPEENPLGRRIEAETD